MFEWKQADQSVDDNTTEVYWTLSATTTSAGAVYKKNRTWAVTIDGTKYTGTVNVSLDTSSTQELASGTATINHNSDGTKTFAYSFSQQFELTLNSGKYMSTYSGSGTDTLTTIPRKSSISVPDGSLRSNQTIAVTQQSSNFTHSIKAVCGGSTLYIKADGTTSATEVKHNDCSIPWTPPIDWASQAPQGQSVTVTFTITTYNGSTSIGTNTDTATYAIPSDIYSPLSFAVSEPTGYVDYYGNYIQGKSKLSISLNTYGVYGAWIKSYKVTVDGKTYTTGTANGNTITIETETITGHGELDIVATVTDSRDRPTSTDAKITVLKYEPPSITSLTAFRSDENGTNKADGGYITVRFSSDVYSLNNKNGAWYKLYYKTATTAETEVVLNDYTGIYSVTDGSYTFKADVSSYDILLKVGDMFITIPQATTGPSLSKVWSLLKKGGKIAGAALGKLAELEDVFDIAFQTRFLGGILHPVLPTNSDLDNEKTPKTYMLLTANSYQNAPESGIGMFLEIVGQKDASIIQRISVFNKDNPREYERIHYASTGWGDWVCTRGDFVIEQGEKDGWMYRKWNSGTGECWKTLTHNTAVNNQWGSVYLSPTAIERQSYPFPFIGKPVENVTAQGNGPVWVITSSSGNGVNGAYQSARYHLCCPGSQSSIEYYISYYCIGKWK